MAAVLTGLAWLGIAAGVFHGTQLRLSDSLFPAIAPDPRVVVVAIDQPSLDEIGRWPWDRVNHARIIDRLTEEGAGVVGYDVTFTERSEPDSDRELAEAITAAGNVHLGATAEFEGRATGRLLRADRFHPPIPDVAAGAAATAHVNIRPDPDGVTRSVPLVIETTDGELVPALAYALFQAEEGLGGPVTLRTDGVQAGGTLVPTGAQTTLDVNFAEQEQFTTFSAIEVLEGRTPPGAFRDKIVLVGVTPVDLGDVVITPLDKSERKPGVFVHANALNTMLQGAFLEQLSGVTPTTLGSIFLLALVVALAVAFLPTWLAPVVALAAGAGYFLYVFQQFDRGRVLNLFYPVLILILAYIAALAVRYLTEVRERRRVTRTFTRYVASDVVEELLASPDDVLEQLKGVTRPLSVLFSDLRGFTQASDGAEPEQVVAALNVYLDAMVRAVIDEGGTIDKFMGDCVMAFWNAPREDADHAAKAVRAAVKMLDNIDRAMAEREEARGLRVKGCGVGVATGEAVVGNIGSVERLDYTVVGDTVNTSSRLCGVADAGQIVVTEETARIVGEGFRLAELPPLSVKGKAQPLKVFQVLREGQEAKEFAEDAVLDATEEKGRFEPVKAPPKAAGYAPVEPPLEATRTDES